MIRKLYDWGIGLAQTPLPLWALAAVTLIESSVFPGPARSHLWSAIKSGASKDGRTV